MIGFAEHKDEDALREILWEYGMDTSGVVEDYVVLKEKDQVLAGGKIVEDREKGFFLEVFGVKKEHQQQGLGGELLGKIVSHPWKFCKNPISEPIDKGLFVLTTLSRGAATGFYKKYGFSPCDFAQIPEPYRQQCDCCPEKESCSPVPMLLMGGN